MYPLPGLEMQPQRECVLSHTEKDRHTWAHTWGPLSERQTVINTHLSPVLVTEALRASRDMTPTKAKTQQ